MTDKSHVRGKDKAERWDLEGNDLKGGLMGDTKVESIRAV
jgi:hypothetical protein